MVGENHSLPQGDPRMSVDQEIATDRCSCGCGSMTTVTSAGEECGCGCACCGEAVKAPADEIAELTNLRQSIDERLAELGG